MLEPTREWERFFDEGAKIEKLKELGLLSPKASKVKLLYYKGLYTSSPAVCDVVGIVDNDEIVIEVEGKLHSLHPDYLKQMQKANFSRMAIIDSEVDKLG